MRQLLSLTTALVPFTLAAVCISVSAQPPDDTPAPAPMPRPRFPFPMGPGPVILPKPVPPPANPPVIDPAASALLEKSVEAYKALKGLSASFLVETKVANKEKPVISKGRFAYAMPSKTRIEFDRDDRRSMGSDKKLVTVNDGVKLWQELPTTPVTYQVMDLPKPWDVPVMMQSLDTTGTPLISSALSGRNLSQLGPKWQTIALLPENTVKLEGVQGYYVDAAQLTLTLKFDATDNLLRSLEYVATTKNHNLDTTFTFSDVEVNPKFEDETFTYTPAPDVKLYVPPPAPTLEFVPQAR